MIFDFYSYNYNPTLEGYSKIYLDLFPFSLIIPITLTAVIGISLLLLLFKLKRLGCNIFKITLGVTYFFTGFLLLYAMIFLAFFPNVIGFTISLIIAIFILIDLKRKRIVLKENSSKKICIISYFLVITGLVFYPLFQLALGQLWPRLILFGAGQCPTTILTIGILIITIPNTSKFLLALTSITGIMTGILLVLLGIYVDLLLLIAGIIGALYLIKYWNQIH